ncbi:MAG: sulfatase-like hydrolase/transferase [Phycisphaerae bacterium]
MRRIPKIFAFLLTAALMDVAVAQTIDSDDCLASSASVAARPDNGPNIWLILLDDADYQHYRFLGSPAARTPNLDFILASGCVFENGYVTMSTCRPTIASLLSGKTPDEHLIRNNDVDIVLDPRELFTAELIHAGYYTFLGGKFFEGRAGARPEAYGFRCYEKAGPQQQAENFPTAFVRTGQDRFLRLAESSPVKWFALWAPLLPHTPFDAPRRYRGRIDVDAIVVPPGVSQQNQIACRNEIRDYLGNLAWLDDAIGEGLARLIACGQLENTLIITVADNGWAAGSIAKQSPYEKGNRTHISFTWINKIEPKVRDDLVSVVDIPPTVMELIGSRPPHFFSGRSLAACLLQDAAPVRDAIAGVNYSLLPFPDEPDDVTNSLVARWSRRDRYKYIRFYRPVTLGTNVCCLRWQFRYLPVPSIVTGEEQLFDLEDDPFERSNRVSDPALATILAQLRADADAVR